SAGIGIYSTDHRSAAADEWNCSVPVLGTARFSSRSSPSRSSWSADVVWLSGLAQPLLSLLRRLHADLAAPDFGSKGLQEPPKRLAASQRVEVRSRSRAVEKRRAHAVLSSGYQGLAAPRACGRERFRAAWPGTEEKRVASRCPPSAHEIYGLPIIA